jgi:capsular polysaccharide biosynthesis protein
VEGDGELRADPLEQAMTGSRSLARLKGDIRTALKAAAGPAGRTVGLNLLSQDETQARLKAYTGSDLPGAGLQVLTVGQHGVRRLDVLRAGLVRVNGRDVLDVDYGNRAAFQGTRVAVDRVRHALVLWSHLWTGYYHWVVDVLPKICLFQAAYGASLEGRTLCYPSFGEPYEGEYLRLLGIPQDQVVDTRQYRLVRVAEDVALVPLPGWYKIQPAVGLLRDRLTDVGPGCGPSRIYLSRSGRRVVTNEDQVVALLASYGFELVDDRPRPVEEQIGLFRHASVIVAPHGAALANLTWSAPGTLLIELLPARYPPGPESFYETLCSRLGLRYRALVERNDDGGPRHWTAMRDDITVDVAALGRALEEDLA